jgi:cellulose synthase/poly-beta-1,6-N-acetylglucosamine synthase-like glycosyltransferase
VTIFFALFLPIWIVLLADGGLKLWLLAVRLWGKSLSETSRSATASTRWFSIAIVIPAHNEAEVIGETVLQLRQLRYPADRYAVLVIADGCTDQTANRAREHGARCVERAAQAAQGKGRALSWFLTERTEEIRSFDIVLICDADSRLQPDALAFINQAFVDGCFVIQANVERETEASSVGAAVALPEALSQEVDDQARTRLGWSAPLRGTGMAFRPDILTHVGVHLRTRAEDLELSLRLAVAGVTVTKAPDVVVYDPKPPELTGATRQRARWLQGHWEVMRWYWRDALPVFRSGRWGDRALIFSLSCRPRTLMMGVKALLAGGGFLGWFVLGNHVALVLGGGASIALLADFLYYFVGFLFLTRSAKRGERWRMVLYLPIWLGAFVLSIFSTNKWLRVRDKAVER